MRILYHLGDEDRPGRSTEVMQAFAAGCERHGDTVEAAKLHEGGVDESADVVCVRALQNGTRSLVDRYQHTRTRVIIFDKGIIRNRNRSNYNRVSIDGGSPLLYLMRESRPMDRWERLEIEPAPRKSDGEAVIYANNSQKVHNFYGAGLAQELTEAVFADIRRVLPGVPLIYRPKPRLREVRKMHGIDLSLRPEQIEDAIENSCTLVTYWSNCAVNALLAGVPAICLGPCAANPVCGDRIDQLLDPPFPSDKKRLRWLGNLAWTQWTDEEFASGEMWDFIKRELAATEKPSEPV